MKRHIIIGIACLVALISFWPVGAQRPVGLRIDGVTLRDATGDRFIISGINLETWRDKGCSYVTDGTYKARSLIATKLQSLGINAVRLNYNMAWLGETGNLEKFVQVAQELTSRGMYVMPSDHSYTGKPLVNSAASFPMFKRITDAFRAANIEQWLIWNPFNEPFGTQDSSWEAWLAAQQNVLTYLRKTLLFDGVVVLDTKYYALQIDTGIFDKVIAFDANLRGGTSNVIFALHYYPTNGMTPVDQAYNISDKYPMTASEIGQYNASPTNPQYVRDVIAKWFQTARDKGHNGLWAWLFNFCDDGKMFEDWTNGQDVFSDPLVMSPYGQIWATNYYSKFATVPPPPATIVVQNPTATATTIRPTAVPTNTKRPTNTPNAPTLPPTSTPACDALLESTVTFNGRSAKAVTCIKYQ